MILLGLTSEASAAASALQEKSFDYNNNFKQGNERYLENSSMEIWE